MRHPFRILLLSLACSAALAAQAQTVPADVPAGELSTALDTLARQTGSQFVYRADQLKGVRTRGSHGAATCAAGAGPAVAGHRLACETRPVRGGGDRSRRCIGAGTETRADAGRRRGARADRAADPAGDRLAHPAQARARRRSPC
jgi:hypothetical protein